MGSLVLHRSLTHSLLEQKLAEDGLITLLCSFNTTLCTSLIASSPNLAMQELEAIKAKVREMEKEEEWLQELQAEAKNLIMRSEAGTVFVSVLRVG